VLHPHQSLAAMISLTLGVVWLSPSVFPLHVHLAPALCNNILFNLGDEQEKSQFARIFSFVDFGSDFLFFFSFSWTDLVAFFPICLLFFGV
jgi:hypothetical protein